MRNQVGYIVKRVEIESKMISRKSSVHYHKLRRVKSIDDDEVNDDNDIKIIINQLYHFY